MYIAEEAFKKAGIKANIQYHTALPGARQNIHPDVFLTLCAPVYKHGVFAFLSFVWSEEVCGCSLGGGEGEVRIFDQHILKPHAHFET